MPTWLDTVADDAHTLSDPALIEIAGGFGQHKERTTLWNKIFFAIEYDNDVTDSVNSNDATNSGVTFSSGTKKLGTHSGYNTGSDYITPTSFPSDRTSGAFSVWFKKDANTAEQRAYANSDDGHFIQILANYGGSADTYAVQFYDGVTNYASGTVSNITDWNCIGFRWIDGDTGYIYINGVEVDSVAIGNLIGLNQGWKIGSARDGTTNYSGYIDNAIQFDSDPGATVMTEIYNAGIGKQGIQLQYSSDSQTIHRTSGYSVANLSSLDTFTLNVDGASAGTVLLRGSKDGVTWQWHNGSSWVTSTSLSEANTAADFNTNLPSFDTSADAFYWQYVLTGDGSQQNLIVSGSVTYTVAADPIVVGVRPIILDSSGNKKEMEDTEKLAVSLNANTDFGNWNRFTATNGVYTQTEDDLILVWAGTSDVTIQLLESTISIKKRIKIINLSDYRVKVLPATGEEINEDDEFIILFRRSSYDFLAEDGIGWWAS